MSSSAKNTALLLASDEQSLDTDYSDRRLALSTEGGLQYATKGEQVLGALRNGIRMSLGGAPEIALIDGLAGFRGGYSSAAVHVAGVDEADLVKYDGEHIYALVARPQPGGLIRNVLKVASTNLENAGIQVTSEFALEGERSSLPLLYQVRAPGGNTEYVVAVSQSYQDWLQSPDRTVLQLLDVRDPCNVSQAWKIELDGWLRASRKMGDMLYLVSSYRPRLSGLKLPADALATREANERRILGASAADLLPCYSVDGGVRVPLVTTRDCVLPANLSSRDAYADLVVITAIDLNARRVTDVNYLSTNVNGVYVSLDSLYVGGEGYAADGTVTTVLHKFGLNRGDITYRASGTVSGRMNWLNTSCFMDEFRGDLRIVTSRSDVYSLSVLRETPDRRLALMARLPIGKPGEEVHAVRFFGERAYVVTANVSDPLHAIDLSRPVDPFIAGDLDIPGLSTYLHSMIGPTGAQLLLSARKVRTGIKVELFDVTDLAQPRSLGAQVFGQSGEVTHQPLLPTEPTNRYRIALPIDLFDSGSRGGIHLLEIDDLTAATPRLTLASTFVGNGDRFIGTLWDRL
ncbi:beta-propeller domain-containing protein [Steroidobacter flavus]|uniref:Beta-propeller domain-containing protein n=1 Tax=Steroidobacter flavus TaxID=1842136 RepID=A0ABV8T1D5_9GAMM